MSVSASDPPAVITLSDPSTEFATDIADAYPTKEVTLVRSRNQLLPRFDKWMHDAGTIFLSPLPLARLLMVYTRQLWIGSAR